METSKTSLKAKLLAGHCISHPIPHAGLHVTSPPSSWPTPSAQQCVCVWSWGAQREAGCKFPAAVVRGGGAVQWEEQEFWGHTDLGFKASFGIFLFQALGQVRSPLCFILGSLFCEMGIKEPPNLTVEGTKYHTTGKAPGTRHT